MVRGEFRLWHSTRAHVWWKPGEEEPQGNHTQQLALKGRQILERSRPVEPCLLVSHGRRGCAEASQWRSQNGGVCQNPQRRAARDA